MKTNVFNIYYSGTPYIKHVLGFKNKHIYWTFIQIKTVLFICDIFKSNWSSKKNNRSIDVFNKSNKLIN